MDQLRKEKHESEVEVGKVYAMSVAPFVQIPPLVAKKMLDVSQIKTGEVLYELGCGDGLLVILAAKEFGVKTTGVELRGDLVERARAEVKRLNLEDRVTLVQADFFDVPISEADVITLYLSPGANDRLRPKLEAELKPGARVISLDFEVPEWKPSSVYNGLYPSRYFPSGQTIYAYRIGEHL